MTNGTDAHAQRGVELGEIDPVDALVQIAFTVTAVLTRVAAEHDVSLTQLRVFGILRDRRPGVTELADFLGLEKSTMSGLVKRAEQRGLVERSRGQDDGRALEIGLTAAGSAVAERAHRQVAEALAPVVAGLTGDETAAVERVTRSLQAAAVLGWPV